MKEGCNVINTSRDATTGDQIVEVTSLQGHAGKILSMKSGVMSRELVDAMVSAAHDAFGPVDILVNNVGASRILQTSKTVTKKAEPGRSTSTSMALSTAIRPSCMTC